MLSAGTNELSSKNEEGCLLSAIPPEMISAVVGMLVALVIASVASNYIIQKCTSCMVPEIGCAQVEELKAKC